MCVFNHTCSASSCTALSSWKHDGTAGKRLHCQLRLNIKFVFVAKAGILDLQHRADTGCNAIRWRLVNVQYASNMNNRLYFERGVDMQPTPYSPRGLRSTLHNATLLERFYLCTRRIEQELNFSLYTIDLELLQWNDLVTAIDCARMMSE